MAAVKKKGSAAKSSSSSSSIDANTAKMLAAVSYIIPLIGLVLYFVLKKGENNFARFHSLQSVLLGVTFFIISLVVGILSAIITGIIGIIPIIGGIIALLVGLILALLSMGLWLIFIVVGIFCLLKVLKDDKFKLPIIGKIAENNS